ncbi:MAG: ParB N-terminal domain-containing protein [Candidatus Aminicenantes bacterium]|nr:MAG: ParB N-terminal domain-containing protein [Candidatus Aminicenantes bacterium]
MKIKKISLDQIFLEDERFRISYYYSLERMILSLKNVGLINPPLVVFRDDHFILVSGWKRVLACREISLSPIPVRVSEEEDELKTFLTAFYEKLALREFDLLEKAEILSKLKKLGEAEDKIVRHFLPLLNIPSTLSHLDMFLSFSRFKPELKRMIAEKNMPFSSVQLLSEFKPGARKLLLPLLLPIGQNKQRELLDDLLNISRKSDIPAEKLLVSKELQDTLKSDSLSPLQKSDKIRLLLKRKRYPSISSMRDSFNSLLRIMGWPKEISVKPSPFFEGEDVSVSFSFKNNEELQRHLHMIKKLSSRKEFSRLLNLD